MRSIIRLAAAGAVALPILIGSAGIASAHEDGYEPGYVDYNNGAAFAGPDGSIVHAVGSGASSDGEAYFYELFMGSGAHGAGVFGAVSYTDGTDAYYFDEWSFAGEYGAATGYTDSAAVPPSFGQGDHATQDADADAVATDIHNADADAVATDIHDADADAADVHVTEEANHVSTE